MAADLYWDKTAYVLSCGAEDRDGKRKPKVWRLGTDERIANAKKMCIRWAWGEQKDACKSQGINPPIWQKKYLDSATQKMAFITSNVDDAAHVQSWLNHYGNDKREELPSSTAGSNADASSDARQGLTLVKAVAAYEAELDDDIRTKKRTGSNADRHKVSLRQFVRFIADQPYDPSKDKKVPKSEDQQRVYFDTLFSKPSPVADRLLEEIGYAQVKAFVSNISNRQVSGYAPDTIKTTVDQVRQFFTWLETSGQYRAAFNPVVLLQVDKAKLMTLAEAKKLNTGQDTFTVDELKILFGKANDHQKFYLLAGLNLCATQQTLTDLLPEDIDLKAGVVEFIRGKTRHVNAGRGVTGRYHLWAETLPLLAARLAKRPKPARSEYACHALLTEEGFPLVRHDGGAKGKDKVDSVRLTWEALLKKAGAVRPEVLEASRQEAVKQKKAFEEPKVRWLPFKYLRKTMATWIEELTDEATAKQGLAQSRTGVTQRHYLGQKKFISLEEAMVHVHDVTLKPMFGTKELATV